MQVTWQMMGERFKGWSKDPKDSPALYPTARKALKVAQKEEISQLRKRWTACD